MPLLERYGVDLVLTGHSHSYERSYLIDGHYGLSDTFTDPMKKSPGDGSAAGDGVYRKPATVGAPHAGAVYAVAGTAGKLFYGPLDHPAMAVSFRTLGSMVLDVNGNRLDAIFLDSIRIGDAIDGIRDAFTILKLPEVSGSVAENTAAGEGVVTVADENPEDDLAYSLAGLNGHSDHTPFTITAGGELQTRAALDYEQPTDADGNSIYELVVSVEDGEEENGNEAGTDDSVLVTIHVTDMDEAGTVSLPPDPPQALTPLTARLDDPDRDAGHTVSWQWTSSANRTGPWTAIGGATAPSYTPQASDVIKYLRATATYEDRHAPNQSAFSDASAQVTAHVQSVAPEITSAATFTVDEGTTAVETLTAEDQDSAAADLEWSKAGGADADDFTLSTDGALAFAAAPDYENPGDADGDNVYEVTVQVSDGTDTDTEDVVVTVENVDEAGAVSLFPAQLRVRTVVRANLTDPDGDVRAVSWRWAESSDKTTWTNIDGAVRADYLPTDADPGQYLRATARYTDGEGAGKTAVAASEATVGEREPGPELSVKTLVSGLRFPWGIAFTPDGTMLFTERDGHRQQDPLPDPPEGLSSRLTDGTLQTVSADFSDLDTDANGGVMGLEVDPDFVDNRRIYICQQRTGSLIQVVAWTIDATYTTASRANDPLVGNIPRVDNHNGCRLRFGPDGNLWISTGDTEAIGTVPQDLNSLGGKILRVDPLTGAAPADNPFPGSLVYSYGHRNPQGLALRPGTRQMWAVEHGPTVDDEINLLRAGANYGWDPVPTDGNGDPTSGYDDTAPMTDLVKFPGAVEARWSSGDPTLATSGGIFLEGEQWGLWEGRLAVATLKGRSLRIFEFTEDGTFVSHVVPEELDHFRDRDHRLRTPMIGPDNALYLSTSTRGWRDEILRVTPQQAPEFPNGADTRQVTENTGGDMVVATVEATDYNHDELTYTLGGTDGESFYILDENIGELRVRSTTQLDYETRREYEVTVTATDAQNTSDTVTLTIEVTDVEHEGTVSLPLTQPRVGSPVQASLSDPDGGVTGTTWQWERSDDGVTGWEDIDGARSASYTPGTDDIGKYLRATATYTNTHGPGKTAQSVTSDAVGAVPNTNPEFPSAPVVRRVAEHTAEGQPIGSPVEADDADGDSLRYTLSGRDGNLFGINRSSGQLLTRAALDYEMANEYEVDVSVSDGKDTNAVSDNKVDDSVRVTIEVTNVDEPGSVSLLPAQLRVWTVVRATLSDPDGVDLHAVSWQWAASSDGVSWTNVPAPEGTRADYAPTDSVQGQYLRATASYTDGQGTGKTTEVVSDNVVGERESGPELTVVPLVSGLSVPWGIAFAPDGTMLFTERGDRLSSRLTDGTVQSVSADFDDLLVSGEAGLMAIVVAPAFASNRRFYTCQAHTGPEVQVIAWTINATYTAATRAEDPLVGNIPAASRHSGCRLRFGPHGYLWIATGDASAGTVPQDLNSLGGKVLRVDAATGAAAAGNPFGSRIYTYGHRNVQGLARRPGTNQMWSVEHGPTVDDEINLLSAGGNYGWDPVPSYNEGVPMTDLVKFPGAVEARWSSGNHTLATSGGIFLEGEDWGEWDGRLAVAALKTQLLRVFEFTADGTFVSQVAVPAVDGAYGRLRTPMLGPDGALYVTTSNGRGQDKILRVSASRAPAFLTDTETRNVDENNNISTFVAKVLALDSDGDTLTYTLSGPDAESFSIPDDAVGAMWANVEFDYETKRSYEVTVTATDPQGLNDSTTLTITVTDMEEPPAAPGAPMVSAKAGTTDSLDVIWVAPPNAGKPGIESYDLQYRKGEIGGWTDGPQDQTTTRATITGLEADSSYHVQVRATNDEGDSPWSVAEPGQTDAPPDDDPAPTQVTLTLDPREVSENAGSRAVRVTGTLDGGARPTPTEVAVTVGSGSDTATEGEDYAEVPALELTIPANRTDGTVTFALRPTNDRTAEGTEIISVRGSVAGLSVAPAELALVDDDVESTRLTLTPSPSRVSEAAAPTEVSVTASLDAGARATDTAVTVTVGAPGDSATEGSDYAFVSTLALTIPANETSGQTTFTLRPQNDAIAEGAETITVGGRASGLAVEPATLTLSDDDRASRVVTLSVAPASVSEDVPEDVTVTAALDAGARAEDMAVRLTVGAAGDTAVPGTDYERVSERTLIIPAGATGGTATFRLAPLDNDSADGARTLSVTGSTPVAELRIEPASGARIALDDDDSPAVLVTPEALTVVEAESNTYAVTLQTRPTADVTVTITGASGDLRLDRTSLVFTRADWRDPQDVTVTAADDADSVQDAAVTLRHVASGAAEYRGLRAELVVSIRENDPGLVFSETALSVPEGQTANYTVALATLPTANVTVRVTGESGDLSLDRSRLQFTRGDWDDAQTITVAAAEDDDTSTDAAVTLAHQASGGGYDGIAGTLRVTIAEDDRGGGTGGGSGGGSGGGGPRNRPPVVTAPIGAQVLEVEGSVRMDATEHFRDPERRTMTFEAESADVSVATVEVDGSIVTVGGIAHGVTAVTVTAVDHRRLRVSQGFTVSVGRQVSFARPQVSAPEGGTATLTVVINRPRDVATTVRYVLGVDADPATPDADAADHDGMDGEVTIATGATEARIGIAIGDDPDIEPPRERFTVTLQATQAQLQDFGFGVATVRVTIDEGVCDRTRQVRNALRRSLPCAAVSATDLGGRRDLDLANTGLAALRGADLSSLSGLTALDLSGNVLTSLPEGLFAGLGALGEVRLQDNPGAPFVLRLDLVRTDAAPWAPAPARVVARVREGAPFALRAALSAVNGTLSPATALVPAGMTAGTPITVVQEAAGATRVTATAPAVPDTRCGVLGTYRCFQGIATAAGETLVLFKAPPEVTDTPSGATLAAEGDAARMDLSALFAASDGGALTYVVGSSDPTLATASVAGDTLTLASNEDGREGAVTITVTATDEDGLSVTLTFEATVESMPRGLLRGWRRVLLEQHAEPRAAEVE